jgi:hypothetical protein
MKKPKTTIKSEVNVRKNKAGYFIEVTDGYYGNVLAVTREELEKIVLYGEAILKSEE